MLFTGHADITIDAKQRLAIPAKFRSVAGEGTAWICVPWPGGLLRLYTENHFTELAQQGEHSLTPDQDLAELQTTLFGLAERVEPDTANRITLPKSLLDLVGLRGDVAVVGAGDRLEVLDRAAWNAGKAERFLKLPSLVARTESRKGTTNR